MKNILVASAVFLAAFAIIASIHPTPLDNSTTRYLQYLKKFGKAVPKDAELLYRVKLFENFL